MLWKPRSICSRWFVLAAIALSQPTHAKSTECVIEKKATLKLGYGAGMRTVDARIDGHPVTLGLDTGASTIVTPQAALGLNLPRDRRRITRAHGTTAIIEADNFVIKDLEFGGAHYRWKSVPVLSIAGGAATGASQTNAVSGLIGGDILSDYDLEFDFLNDTLTLYSVKGCTTITPSWQGSYTSSPMTVTWRREVLLPVEVDGVTLRAVFDTGATESALTTEAAARLGVTSKALKDEQAKTFIGIGAIKANLPTHLFGKLSGAGLALTNRRLGILKRRLLEGDMLFGRDFMSWNRFWVSYSTRTIFTMHQTPTVTSSAASAARQPPPNVAASSSSKMTLDECVAAYGQQLRDWCRLIGGRSPSPVPSALPSPIAAHPVRLAELSDPCFKPYLDQPPSCWASTPPPDDQGGLGVKHRRFANETVKALNLSNPEAVAVIFVIPGSPAEKAGFKAGDAIVALDGVPLHGETLQSPLRTHKAGGDVRLDAVREGETKTLTATLGRAGCAKVQRYIDANEREERDFTSVFSKEKYPLEWAHSRGNVGLAYKSSTEGTTAENLEKAIAALEEALSVPEFREEKLFFAATEEALAVALLQRNRRDDDRVEEAIRALESALTIRQQNSTEWAEDELFLGRAYERRGSGDAIENQERAIAAYNAAASAFRTNAERQTASGAAFGAGARLMLKRFKGDSAENTEAAIRMAKDAVSILANSSASVDWAMAQRTLADAYMTRSAGEVRESLKHAREAYDAALTVLTKEAFPKEFEEIGRAKLQIQADGSPETTAGAKPH